jgi:integrase
MAYKRCHEKGCKEGLRARLAEDSPNPRCTHSWHIWARVKNEVERGPVKNFGFLLLPGQRTPETKTEAEMLEKTLATYLSIPSAQRAAWVAGRLPPDPDPAPGPGGSGSDQTVTDVLDRYHEDQGQYLADKGYNTIMKHIKAAFGTEPYTTLFDAKKLKPFLSDIFEPDEDDEPHIADRNRHFARWRCITYWWVADQKLKIDYEDLPFYDKLRNPRGIRRLPETPRSRRLQDDEEARIIAACVKRDDGGQLLGRYYCAVDAGTRKGEMLKLRNADILSNYMGAGLTIRIRWTVSKTAKERFVPVKTTRLRDWLQARRFLAYPFGQADGTRIEQFREDWESVLLAAGIDRGHYEQQRWVWDEDGDLHWHDLRHECGSRYVEDGTTLPEIMILLGHTKLDTCQRYQNPTFRSLAANMERSAQKRGLL